MKTCIALFRGINVGGNNLIPMKALTPLLERSGCRNVRTYIQSGNIVFEHGDLPSLDVAPLIENEFGFKPEIIFLLEEDLIAAVESCPYLSEEAKSCHFYFCTALPSPNLDKLETLKADSENYFLNGRVFYLHAPEGIGRSKLVANIERCLGVSATGRNLNTINRVMKMVKMSSP